MIPPELASAPAQSPPSAPSLSLAPDSESISTEFCYLDHAATSPLLPEAYSAMLAAMQLSLSGQLGNAAALHQSGHAAHELVEAARAAVAQLINADPSEIIFTSGGSESNNTVMHIFAGQQIITSQLEHPSVLAAAAAYRGDGPRQLHSCMFANNELGTIFPIKILAREAHAVGAYFHTDATQALGKVKIDVQDLAVDYLTASAHKIGGPVGIGILYVKKGAPYQPFIFGGQQENRRRAGTTPVVNIAGFGAAAKYVSQHRTWEIYEQRIRPIKDLLARRILAEIPHSKINGSLESPEMGPETLARLLPSSDKSSDENSKGSNEGNSKNPPCDDGQKSKLATKLATAFRDLPNILNVSFRAAEGESTQLYLDLEAGVQVSTGSACAGGQPSHTLMALTGDPEIAHSSIRFSLGLNTTEQDINRVMSVLPGIIRRLQGISTIKIKESL